MKKIIYSLIVITIMLSACVKESSTSPPVQRGANVFTDAAAQNLKLGASVSGIYMLKSVNVKMIRYDYNAGHTPMLAFDSTSYSINTITSTFWRNLHSTIYPYRGLMRVIITMDSVGTNTYTRDVLLTDSLGYIVNLDTCKIAQPGTVGVCRISDAVPKSL